MQRTVPARVTERLRRLRDRFGEGVRERQVDHDHDHLTGTHRKQVPERTFFLGEIWWADRKALGDPRPYREASSHLPALVTRREEHPQEPIEMAPSARPAPASIIDFCFRATQPPKGLEEATVFLLPYRRPVNRHLISAPMGALKSTDKQQLARLMEELRL